MSRAQLREFMALFVAGSAVTVAAFFLALWLLPEQPFVPFSLISWAFRRNHTRAHALASHRTPKMNIAPPAVYRLLGQLLALSLAIGLAVWLFR
jgi:hypothetical protein